MRAFDTLIIEPCILLIPSIAEVTGKAIEETAAVILRLYHDRRHRCSMPRISKRY